MYRFIVLPQLKRAPMRTALYFILLAVAVAFFALSLNLYQNSSTNIQTSESAFSTIAVSELWTNVDKNGNPVATTDPNSVGKHAVPVPDFNLEALSALPGVTLVDLRRMLAAYISDGLGRFPVSTSCYDLIHFTIEGDEPILVDRSPTNLTYRIHVTKSAVGQISYEKGLYLSHVFLKDLELTRLAEFHQNADINTGELWLYPNVEYVASVFVEYSNGSLHGTGKASAQSVTFGNDYYARQKEKIYFPSGGTLNGIKTGDMVIRRQYHENQPFGIWRAADVAADSELATYFDAVAKAYKISAYSFAVTTTNRLEGIPLFHQQKAYVCAGRSFTSEDYTEGSNVCLVPRDLAEAQGWSIGDNIHLGFYQYDGFYDNGPMPTTYGWNPAYEKDNGGIFSQNKYTIVGFWDFSPQDQKIHTLDDRTTNIERGMIFVPTASVDNLPLSAPVTGSRLTVHLKNGSSEEFLAALNELDLTSAEMNVTILDQGYADAQSGLQSMLSTAQFLLALSSVLLVVAGVLLAFFYTQSQKQNMALMRLLGCNRRQAGTMSLLGSLLILLPGGLLGVSAGHLLTDRVASAILNSANALDNPEYAGFREIFGVQAEVDFALSAQPAVSAAALALAAALFLMGCMVFTLLLLRKEPREALADK